MSVAACQSKETADRSKMDEDMTIAQFRVDTDTLRLRVGEEWVIHGIITPEEFTSQVPLKWSSSDNSIVTVDSDGKVKAVGYGVAYVQAEVKDWRVRSGKQWRIIPVFVDFSETHIADPEEAYRKWLGLWSLNAPAYVRHKESPENPDYWAQYSIAIMELEHLASFKVIGWERFYGATVSFTNGDPYPGGLLTFTARFDKDSGNLLFVRDVYNGFVLSPYWSRYPATNWSYTVLVKSFSGSFLNYGYKKDDVIGYAQMEGEKYAVVRGRYRWIDGFFYNHLGMGFTSEGCTPQSDPFFFPMEMFCMDEVPVKNVSLSASSLVMETGTEKALTVKVKPADLTDFHVEWVSSDPGVVSVEDGLLHANSTGTATVSAQVGKTLAHCTVTVKKPFIHFYSSELHDSLLEKADVDGDGEISFEEAAALTTLGVIGRRDDYHKIRYFHELQYFTSLTELEPRCLYGSGIWALTIPANIRKVGTLALASNGASIRVILLGPPPEIGESAFGVVSSGPYALKIQIEVPGEYYDLYVAEAGKEGSAWADYLPYLMKSSD